jgi:hypothetical protein
MRKFSFPLTIAAALCLVSILVVPAQAQLNHTWVASNGSDAANCDRPTPCATFATAFARTFPGGEITCVDSGNFAAGFGINKSITINCANAIGSVTLTGGLGVGVFNINTAATDIVVLRGLDLDGTGSSSGVGSISFFGAGVLQLDKVKINGFRGSNTNGISFTPNGPARLDVSDSFIADNGTAVSTAGILIRPVGGGSANVSVSRTDLKGNFNGIFVDGSGGGGAVNLSVRDSVVTGSANCGIVINTNGPALTALVDRTTITSSLNAGIAVGGAGATVAIGNSSISGNVTGVLAVSGGNLRTYKNNQIKFNLTNGTPIAAVDALD